MNKSSRAYRFIKNLPATIRNIKTEIEKLNASSQALNKNLDNTQQELSHKLSSLGQDVENIKQVQSEVLHQLNTLKQPRTKKVSATTEPKANLQADNHDLDSYYLSFEERFRGSEDEIYKRLKNSYTKLLTNELSANLKTLPVVDIGCGRGEFLRLCKNLGLKSIGIDLNEFMIEHCHKLGYEAIQEDAFDYLRAQPASSIAVISGIHIVEHIPFETLLGLLRECFRVIAPHGFVLFETPNAENIVVGSGTFWYDSSHLKPLLPDVLAFMLQYVGFSKTNILRMHPADSSIEKMQDPALQKMATKFFGSQDYAAIGFKAKPL